MNPKEPRLVYSTIAAEQEAAHSLFRGAIGATAVPDEPCRLFRTPIQRLLSTLAFAIPLREPCRVQGFDQVLRSNILCCF